MKPRYLYFFLCAIAAVPGRFLPIYYNKYGLDAAQIGLLLGLQTILAIFATPFFSHKADLSTTRQSVIVILQITSTICFLLQSLFLPSLHFLPPDRALPFIFSLGLLYGVSAAPIDAIVRGIAVAFLQKHHGERGFVLFGKERLWGAVSWAILSFAVGYLFDIPSITLPAIFIVHTICSAAFIAISILSTYSLRMTTTTSTYDYDMIHNENNSNHSESNINLGHSNNHVLFSFFSVIRPVVFQGGLVTFLFFVLVFLYGYGIAVIENLLFLYLVNDLHASNKLCGLSIVFSVVVEVIMYSTAPYMLRKISAPNVLLISSGAYVIRTFGYAFIPYAPAVLVLELLHGVTFATADAAFVAFIAERGKIGTEATVQSVYTTVRTFGIGIGSAAGGLILQNAGPKMLYISTGLLLMAGSISFAVATFVEEQHQNPSIHTVDENRERDSLVRS